MQPQYLGPGRAGAAKIEALESHCRRLLAHRYVFDGIRFMVRPRNTQVSLTSNEGLVRHEAVPGPVHRNRRRRCQRASNSWYPSALSPRLPHAQVARPKKNTLWLSQSPSRLSLHTQVNTSKPDLRQACGPVSSCRASLSVGGA